jgi:hypothetical protein
MLAASISLAGVFLSRNLGIGAHDTLDADPIGEGAAV